MHLTGIAAFCPRAIAQPLAAAHFALTLSFDNQ
jgi:hypothetical protein